MLCSRTYLVKHLKQRENVAKDPKLKAKLPIKSKGSGQQLLLFISWPKKDLWCLFIV